MGRYTKRGKEWFPLTEKEFLEGMKTIKRYRHRAYVALLYHTGVRKKEALRVRKEQFRLIDKVIYFEVGQRLKGGLHTAPLPIPLTKPYAGELWKAVCYTRKGQRVFPYCSKTGYTIVARVFKYPHYLRLTRLTNLFRAGYTIDQVRSWSGHKSLASLEPYVGYSKLDEMGKV